MPINLAMPSNLLNIKQSHQPPQNKNSNHYFNMKGVPLISTAQHQESMEEAHLSSTHAPSSWNLPSSSSSALLLLFVLSLVVAVVGFSSSVILKKKSGVLDSPNDNKVVVKSNELTWLGWGMIRKALMGLACWSGSSGWQEPVPNADVQPIGQSPVGGGGWDMLENVAASPLWQRRILMGERCELPRFSGLILYDDKGFPLCNNGVHGCNAGTQQGKPVPVRSAPTLKDLL